MRAGIAICALVALPLLTAPALAAGTRVTIVDDGVQPVHGPVQLFAFRIGLASSKPDDFVCAAYIGNNVVFKDHKRAVALADQAFEEFISPACASAAFRSKADGKIYAVGRVFIYVGDEVVLAMPSRDAIEQGMLDGSIFDFNLTRVEYRVKNNIGHTEAAPFDIEYERVSQPEAPVGPSLREPNMTAVPTEIEPGVMIGLENKLDHTYYGDRKPTMLIFFQTQIPWSDKAAQRALSQKVVRALAGERLKRNELKGVSTGAFNEPRRSRFHIRLSYMYVADEDGDMKRENIPGLR